MQDWTESESPIGPRRARRNRRQPQRGGNSVSKNTGRRAKKRFGYLMPLAAVSAVGALLLSPMSPIIAPPAEASSTPISLRTTDTASHVSDMTFLATRSQSKALTKSGTGPYVMTHTNADPSLSYSFPTDANYSDDHMSSSTFALEAQLNESDVRPPRSGSSFSYSSRTTTYAKLTNSGGVPSTPTGSSTTNTTTDGTKSYGSFFGPQVWSEPFTATSSQAVSFEWKAQGGSDDYEVYGFLVNIDGGSDCSASNDFGESNSQAEKLASHTILAHGRGKTADDWNTSSGNIDEAGCYRFRFVNGTYDASGGFASGATFEIRNPILGDAQVITFDQIEDQIEDTSDNTLNLTASTNAGLDQDGITFALHAGSVCTVSGNQVTVKANSTGQCVIRADAPATGSYAAAPTVFMSFNVLDEPTKPVYSGGASVSGSALVCSTLTADEGSWASGGAAISSTEIQWLSNGTTISGATASTYVLDENDVGNSISFTVTKTNSVGSTTATSSSLLIIDARLTGLTLSSGTLSPSFDTCSANYSITTSSSTLSVTPTISAGAESIEVNGSEVLSGEPTNPISLSNGANTITLTVKSGVFSRNITVTANYQSPPTVTALAPIMTSGTQATLQASINANGDDANSITFTITQTGGATQTPTQAALSASSVTGSSDTAITQVVTDLVSGGTYEFFAEAVNSNGSTTSETITFQTPDAPTVTTGNATSITATGADVAGTVLGHSRETDVYVVYSTNADLSSPTTVALSTISAADAATTQNVSSSLTGLTTGTRYYYRFEATNAVGSNFGDTKSFVTVAAPSITHGSHTIAERSATLVATVNANGADISQDIKFIWSTDSGFTSPTEVTATPARVVAGGDRTVSATISSLTPATEYYFKVTATNSVGSSTSTAESFTTLTDPVPTVTLQAPERVTTQSNISVTVRFSEVVTGFQSSDLTIGGSPTYTASPAQDLGSGVYQVTLTTSSTSTGTVTIDLPANRVKDAGDQNNTAATQISVIVQSGQTSASPSLSYTSATAAGGASPTLDKDGSSGVATYALTTYGGSYEAADCAVDSSTGVVTAASAGECEVEVTVAADSFFYEETAQATVVLTKSTETIVWDEGANKVTIRSAAGVNRTTTLTDSDSDGVLDLEMKLGDMVKIGFNTPNSQRVSYSSHGNCPSRIGWDQSQMFPIDGNGDSFYYLKANQIGGCNISGGTHVAQFLSLPSALYDTPLSPGILITVVKGDQSPIAVSGNTSPSFGETVTLTATGGDGTGDRNYAVTGTGCSIETVPFVWGGVSYGAFASGELTNTGAGACDVTVTKDGDARYNAITSDPFTVTFGQGSQEISFTSSVPEDPEVGGTYTPTATASSGLTVSFAASGSCTESAGVVTFGSTGNCTITASQSGDSDYLAAGNATQVIDVGTRNQTITFASISDKEFGDPAFSIAPTSSESDAVITLASDDTDVCTVDSNGIVRLVAAGTCTIHADQPGVAGEVAAASRVSRSFEIYAAGSSAPFITSVSRGLGSLTATLVEPSYTGGATITRYEVQAYDPNGDIAGVNNNCAVSDPQKCTVEGLTEGIAYTLRAKAHHTGGVGSLSPASVAAAPVGNPDAVRELTALADNTSLTISWLAPLDLGGATFDRYEIFIKLSTDNAFPLTPSHTVNSSNAGNYTFTGLVNGASYDVKMVTITDLDTTEIVSNSALVTQVPYTTPNAVRDLAAFELGNSLYITWRYPDFDGGREVTGYEVDVNTGDLGCTVTEMLCVVTKDDSEAFEIDTLASNIAGSGPVASLTYTIPTEPEPNNRRSGRGFIAPAPDPEPEPVTPQVFAPELDPQRAVIDFGGMRMIELRGSNLNLITDVMMGTEPVNFDAVSNELLRLYVRADTVGSMALKIMFPGGEIAQPVTVRENTGQKLNAGSFKGFVAVYAKGYEGSRLSAKIGKDWIIVNNLQSDFVRVVDPVGVGFQINVRIYIDRRLVSAIPLTTR